MWKDKTRNKKKPIDFEVNLYKIFDLHVIFKKNLQYVLKVRKIRHVDFLHNLYKHTGIIISSNNLLVHKPTNLGKSYKIHYFAMIAIFLNIPLHKLFDPEFKDTWIDDQERIE